jgi:arylsulfatase A-like enzyme/lysophospholipase L1-like esterase
MNRISLIFGLVAFSVAGAFSQEAAKRPNIVFIFSDDHAVGAISAYGGILKDAAPTPNLDRIAQEGAVFENSFCANSICGPSRACILTGLHSHVNGFLDNNNSRFDGSQTTFPKLIQKAGYQTALVGKWHLSSDPTGFDYWEILPGQGSYNNPDLIQQGGGKKRYKGYVTDIVTDRAIDWLDKRDKEKPFVLMCQHKAPHRNWSPAPRHYALFDDVTMPEPASLFDDYGGNRSKTLAENEMSIAKHFYWGWDMKFHGESQFPDHFLKGLANGEYARFDEEQKKVWDAVYEPKNAKLIADIQSGALKGDDITKWKYQRYIKDYLRCIRAVDENVGRVLKYLDDNGLTENTIVIYSSDQGFYLGEHGWYDKRWMFEESLKMPFLVRWPGVVPAGGRSKTLIQNIDYGPTFLEIAGVDVPKTMQGRSLVPALKNPSVSPEGWREAIYYAYYGEATHRVARHDGVRTQQHKLMYFPGTDEWNLFDLEKDPEEMRSVHEDPAYSDVLVKMKERYVALRKDYGVHSATVPEARYDLSWWKQRHAQKMKEARKGDYDMLFIGDSITHGWEGPGKPVWDEFYAERKALNIGFGGDRTEQVIYRLLNGELPESVDPKVAVIMIGTNNTGHSMQAADETAEGIERILEILRDRRPEMKILLLGVFPRGEKPDDKMRVRNAEVNALIAKYADGEHVHFLDIGAKFLDENGVLTAEVMPDRLHPQEVGYRIWAEAIEAKVCELGGFEAVKVEVGQ